MQCCYCKRSGLTALPWAALRQLLCVAVLGGASVAGSLANEIAYAPAQYYFPETLRGNLESATGLWVSDAQDPLAYLYGYIPGLRQEAGVPFFGSANFDPIPVLLADPQLTLPQLSQILGNTHLPPGGSVLDLTEAVAAFWANGGRQGVIQPGSLLVPEPHSFWLVILGGSGLAKLCARLRMLQLRELTIQPKQLTNG